MSAFYRYPRTPHVPWSLGVSRDDLRLADCSQFEHKQVVVSEKLDGECTTLYRDHYHARSLTSTHHPSQSWVKQLRATIQGDVPEQWRVVGENVFAFHSIFYTDLLSYFFVFGIYNQDNRCLSWSDTRDYCQILGLETVPVLYRGTWNENLVRHLWEGKGTFPTYRTQDPQPRWPESFQPADAEGYVIRVAESFHYDDFQKNVAKWVCANHVQTSSHWKEQPVLPNLLKKSLEVG